MFVLSVSFLCYFLTYFSIFLTGVYIWVKYRYGYWKRKGIYSPPAVFPLGHIKPVVFNELQMGVHLSNIYSQTKHLPYVGLFMLNRKALLANDLELVKNVFSKDYNYFKGHGFKSNKDVDPLAQHLFNLEGEEWKRIRVKLSPTFTSSKMRFMFETMADCATEMLNYINNDVPKSNVLEIKEILAKFSTDVIGSCAFGIQTNSFKYPDAEFRKMGKKSFTLSPVRSLIHLLILLAPSVVKPFGFRLTDPDVSKFFKKIVPETIKEREEKKITRNDFLQLLIDMNKKEAGTGEGLTMLETTAQVFVFFLAGFETSSTAASFALFELAKNQVAQKTLREDIHREIENAGGKLTYDAVGKMSYLSLVVDEILRMYPVGTTLMRVCTADYKIPGTKDVIEKGTMVMIPVMGIHRDPDIYPDPLTFKPERFTPENVAKRHQFSYVPFGEGPRICIGSRFGLLQVKLAILTVIKNFEVALCDETIMPLQFEPKSFVLSTVGGMFLRLTRRE